MRHLAEKLKHDGGFTYSINEGEHAKEGVAVSYEGTQQLYRKPPTHQQILDYTEEWRGLLSKHDSHLGAWFNESDEYYYLDVSIVIPDLEEAVKIGMANSQVAVFDIGAGKEHLVGDWEK